MKRYSSVVLFTLALVLFLRANAFAETRTTSQSGNWSASTTWGGDSAPVAGDDVIINGGFTVTVDVSNAACLSIQLGGSALGQGTGTLSFNSGSQVTVSGAVNVGPFNDNTTAGSLSMESGGILICEGLIVGRLGTWTAGTGTIEFTATNTIPNDSNIVFNNLTISGGAGATTSLTSDLTVIGNITIQPGRILNAGGLNISLGGDWNNGGAFTNANTVTFNGSGTQTLTANGTGAGKTFNDLTINKISGTLTLNGSVRVNNAFSLAQGTLAVGSSTLTLNGTVTGGGTFTSTSTGTVSYNQGSDGQGVLAWNYGNLVFSAFNKTLASTGMIGIAGTFTPGAAVGHTVTGSTIDFNGASQAVPAFSYNNLTLSGSGTKNSLGGTRTVGGNWTNNAGVVFSVTTLNLNGTTHTNGGTIYSVTVSVGSGATLTNNGTLVSGTALSGAGTLTQGTTGILNIGGTAGITTLDASASGNTVNYYANGQTVAPVTYHHLELSGAGTTILTGVSTINGNFKLSGTVTASATAGMTIGGNFTISSAGPSFDAGSFSHTLKGNWSNAGTFTEGTSTFTLNGTSAQTMSGSTFNNLVIDNVAGVSMLTDGTVSNTLTLASGVLTTGTHTITVTNSASGAVVITSGSVNGEVVRAIAAGATSAYMFTDLNTQLIPDGSQGAIVASIKSFPNTTPPNIGSGVAVNRYYVITPTGALTAKVRLSYLADETNGIPEASMTLFRTSEIVWALVPSISNSPNRFVETATNVSEFSNWTIGNVNNPLPIQLASFTGTMVNGVDAQLRWVTLSEVNNFGFNVLRKRPTDQNYVELPGSFLPGHGTTNEPHTYTFTDVAPGLGRWQYRIKQIDLDGSIHYSDPIQIDIVTGVDEGSQPLTYALKQNYPNPFNPLTTIRYGVPQTSFVTLTVYNTLGQQVAQLVNEQQQAGYHDVVFRGDQLASGVYSYRLDACSFTSVKKLLLLK